MIYVTVGSSEKGTEFDRLIKKIDELAKDISEEIIMQIGSSNYIPKNTKYFRYCSYEKSLSFFSKAKLVIGHCGSGTIINAIKFNVPLIIVPRKLQYGELDTDDHQLILARKLEETHYKIKIIYEVNDLEDAIKQMLNNQYNITLNESSYLRKESLIKTIKDFIQSLKK